jgi:hypothetical protein
MHVADRLERVCFFHEKGNEKREGELPSGRPGQSAGSTSPPTVGDEDAQDPVTARFFGRPPTAYHKAGHAVAAPSLARTVREAWVGEKGAAIARCRPCSSRDGPRVRFNVHKDLKTLDLGTRGRVPAARLCPRCAVADMNSFNDALAKQRGKEEKTDAWTVAKFLAFAARAM